MDLGLFPSLKVNSEFNNCRRVESDESQFALALIIKLMETPMRLKQDKKYGGCRSWVELPDFTGHALVSVISDEEHARRLAEFQELLKQNC